MKENTFNIISEVMLERYILGELPESRMNELSDIISNNPGLKLQIENIKKSNENILMDYPVELTASRIRDMESSEIKKKKKNSRAKFFLIPSFTAAAAAAVFIIFPMVSNYFNDDIYNDTTRIKGVEANIYVYRKTGGDVEQLRDGATAEKNDLLQIAYSASGKELYGAIISIDGRGTVTLHHPINGTSSKIKTGSKVVLQNSYELDDAPAFEKFFFLISGSEIDTEKIISRARILASDPKVILDSRIIENGSPEIQPSKFKETSLTIIKKK